MKTLVSALMMLCLLVLVSPSLAQEEVPVVQEQSNVGLENSVELLTQVMVGAIAFAVVLFALFAVLAGGVALKRFVTADQKLAAFGRTPTGQYVYAGLGSAYGYIDEPTDALVIKATALANKALSTRLEILRQILPNKDEALTEEEVSKGLRLALNAFRVLADGKALPSDISTEALMNELGK